MTSIFSTDGERSLAQAVRALLVRVEHGIGADRVLGCDILEALDLPVTIGDPTAQIDSAIALAGQLGQPEEAVIIAALRTSAKPREPAEVWTHYIARRVTAIALRTRLAQLEKSPA